MDPQNYSLLYLIPLLPLVGAAILGLLGSRFDRGLISVIACFSTLGAFVLTAIATWVSAKLGAPLENHLWDWIVVGRYEFGLTLGLDALSATLLLVITGVGFLIHLYSIGYMEGDPAYWRYFAYLNLFIFAMSVLVLGRSLPAMFIGWEGVGLASYLLIGFWYSDESKARAGKKAFIVNRIGDFGFLIGIFTLVALFGTADFLELAGRAEALTDLDITLGEGVFQGWEIRAVITFACLALFVGATGKSAQIPLFVWIPDAMAGPTPVSALIHAATMVTAGIYMVVRLFFLFELAPSALDLIAWVGALTAVFAATVGLAQNDIKKVLAYSTVSQLGYMFLAVGLGAYTVAIFHLLTHAFFKACLFLGSGAVIHALHGEQDMTKMGGLYKRLPVTFWTFAISTLALCGVFPLSGFFSKDAILAMAWQENRSLFWLGLLGAGLTALYMARLVLLTFGNDLRLPAAKEKGFHLHKPNGYMKWPLMILAALAFVAGGLELPHLVAHTFHAPAGLLSRFLEPVVQSSKEMTLSASVEWALMAGSSAWVLGALALGFVLYRHGPSALMGKITKTGPGGTIQGILQGKYFIDEIYHGLVVAPLKAIASIFAVLIDPYIIDGIAVRGSSQAMLQASKTLRRLQTGNVQWYAAVFVISVAVILLWAAQ